MSRFRRFLDHLTTAFHTVAAAPSSITIDLGSERVKYYDSWGRKGMLPACVAVHTRTQECVAIGGSAVTMQGKNPSQVSIFFPFFRGRIVEEQVARLFFEQFFSHLRISPWVRWRTHVRLTTMGDTSSLQQERFRLILSQVGIKKVTCVSQLQQLATRLNALKALKPALSPASSLSPILSISPEQTQHIVLYGAQTTQVITAQQGKVLQQLIITHGCREYISQVRQVLQSRYHTLISAQEAEKLYTHPLSEGAVTVRGQDVLESTPQSVRLKREDLFQIWSKEVDFLAEAIRSVSEHSWTQKERGKEKESLRRMVFLTGGGSMRPNLIKELSQHTGWTIQLSETPLFDTVL